MTTSLAIHHLDIKLWLRRVTTWAKLILHKVVLASNVPNVQMTQNMFLEKSQNLKFENTLHPNIKSIELHVPKLIFLPFLYPSMHSWISTEFFDVMTCWAFNIKLYYQYNLPTQNTKADAKVDVPTLMFDLKNVPKVCGCYSVHVSQPLSNRSKQYNLCCIGNAFNASIGLTNMQVSGWLVIRSSRGWEIIVNLRHAYLKYI